MSHGDAYTDEEVKCLTESKSLDDFFRLIAELKQEKPRTPTALYAMWKKRKIHIENYNTRHTIKIASKTQTTPIKGSDKSLEELSALRLNESRLQTASLQEIATRLKEIMCDTQVTAEYMRQSLENQNTMIYVLKDTYSLFSNKIGKTQQEIEVKAP